MSARPLWLALLLAGTAAAQQLPVQMIRDCAARISPQRTGLPALEQDCAPLAAALRSLGVQSLFAPGSAERLDRDSLRQLPALLHAPRRAPPAITALPDALRSLTLREPHRSWWQRLEDWLAEHLLRSRALVPMPWLTRWLQRLQLPPAAARVLFYALLAGLVLAAAAVVIRELRVIPRTGRTRQAGARSGEDPATESAWTVARLQREPLASRPVLLFRMLAARLSAAGRLPSDRSLTHRELAARIRLEDPGARALWVRLSGLAESQLYAPESVLARAQDLYVAGFSPLEPP